MQSLASTRTTAETGVRRRRNLGRATTIVAFLLPTFFVYVLFVIFPLAQASYYGLYKWNGLGPLTNYVGLDNFNRVLHDEVFQKALTHNFVILLLSICVQLPLALGLALILRGRIRGRTIFRMIFFLPFVLSEVVTGIVWSFLYHPDSGINNLISAIYSGYHPRGWLGDTDTVLLAIFLVITWKF